MCRQSVIPAPALRSVPSDGSFLLMFFLNFPAGLSSDQNPLPISDAATDTPVMPGIFSRPAAQNMPAAVLHPLI